MALLDFLDKEYQELGTMKVVPKSREIGWKSLNKPLVAEVCRLYLEGVPNSEIARRYGLTRTTIFHWARKGGWEIKRKLLREKDTQVVFKDVNEMKERHIRISKAIQRELLQNMAQKKAKVTVADAIRAMEHEAHLTIPESYNPTIQTNTQINNSLNLVNLLNEAKREKNAQKRTNPG